jgi:hypothetical protein
MRCAGRRLAVTGASVGLLGGMAAAGLALAPAGSGAPVKIACNDVTGLRSAINTANTTPTVPTTINLAKNCTYQLTDDSPLGSGNGLPAVKSPITINGDDHTTIARDTSTPNTAAFRIFEVDGNPSNGNLTLNELRITGGLVSSSAPLPFGGGIVNNNGTLNLNHGEVDTNSAGPFGSGGGIACTGPCALDGSRVHDNSAVSGGGIRANLLTMDHSQVNHNTAVRGDGGGIDGDGGSITVNTSQMDNNTATGFNTEGGGILNFQGTLSLNKSEVNNNSAPATGSLGVAGGGGIENVEGALSLNQSEVDNNTASGPAEADGGGVFSDTPISIISSEIKANTASTPNASGAAKGGGIFDRSMGALNNTQVTNNTASASGASSTAQGGGIWTSSKTLGLNRTEVDNNKATDTGTGGNAQGAGIWNDRGNTLSINRSELKKNTASALSAIAAQGGGLFKVDPADVVGLNLSTIAANAPDNCFPIGSVVGCTG